MQAGCTQAQLAARMGASQTAVSNILRGQTEEPSYARGAALLEMHAELVGTTPPVVDGTTPAQSTPTEA